MFTKPLYDNFPNKTLINLPISYNVPYIEVVLRKVALFSVTFKEIQNNVRMFRECKNKTIKTKQKVYVVQKNETQSKVMRLLFTSQAGKDFRLIVIQCLQILVNSQSTVCCSECQLLQYN